MEETAEGGETVGQKQEEKQQYREESLNQTTKSDYKYTGTMKQISTYVPEGESSGGRVVSLLSGQWKRLTVVPVRYAC